jgi:predicted nucleic acid-binding Zn finger protein
MYLCVDELVDNILEKDFCGSSSFITALNVQNAFVAVA